jgi:hypothetical protein
MGLTHAEAMQAAAASDASAQQGKRRQVRCVRCRGRLSSFQQGAPQQTFSVTLAGYADYQAPKKTKAARLEDEDEEEPVAPKEAAAQAKKAKQPGSLARHTHTQH